jgi:Fe2+ or Zn2+ uptake regulation protein
LIFILVFHYDDRAMRDERDLEQRLRELERRSAEAGQPVTVQRRASLTALVRRRDHPTADALYADVLGEIPGVSKATIYRALDNLVQLGLARRVQHEGSVARYDGNVEPHHHLHCDGCGSIRDVDWELLDSIPAPRIPPRSFEVRDFFVSFRGLCGDCATQSKSKSKTPRRRK